MYCCHLKVNKVTCQNVILKWWEELAKRMNSTQNVYMEKHNSGNVTLNQGMGGTRIDILKPKPFTIPNQNPKGLWTIEDHNKNISGNAQVRDLDL